PWRGVPFVVKAGHDGYVRQFELAVPRDCLAHIDERPADAALEMMECNMHADVEPRVSVSRG
ncbi:MAG TPA: hypothetical protein VLP43_00980, partial [Solirubrobacteraceae bacterium]|nr:hypothetical protein [Solirubrobacteraceae bacterium]